MALKKYNPNLYGVLKRRRQTVATYLEALGIRSVDALGKLLAQLRASHRVSDQFVTEAKTYVKSFKKPVKSAAPKKPVTKKEVVEPEPVKEEKAPTPPKPKKRPKATKKSQPAPKE